MREVMLRDASVLVSCRTASDDAQIKGGCVLLTTIPAHVRSHVHPSHGTETEYGGRLIAKVLITAVQVVIVSRISSFVYRFLPTRPLAFALRGLTVVWSGNAIHAGPDSGPGSCLMHGQRVLIGPRARIGAGVWPDRLGNRKAGHDRPRRRGPGRNAVMPGLSSVVKYAAPSIGVAVDSPSRIIRKLSVPAQDLDRSA